MYPGPHLKYYAPNAPPIGHFLLHAHYHKMPIPTSPTRLLLLPTRHSPLAEPH